MNITVVFCCLVGMALLEGVTGLPTVAGSDFHCNRCFIYNPRSRRCVPDARSSNHAGCFDIVQLYILEQQEKGQNVSHILYKEIDDYEEIWNDKGSTGVEDVSIWRTTNYLSPYCSLGDTAIGKYSRPSTRAILVSKQNAEAVVHPSSFTQIWTTEGSPAHLDCAVYSMSAPKGYECLGGVAMRSKTLQPDKNKYCCIRADYLVDGDLISTYQDIGTRANKDLGLWTIVKGADARGFPGGNFLPVEGRHRPSKGKLLNGDKLKIKLD